MSHALPKTSFDRLPLVPTALVCPLLKCSFSLITFPVTAGFDCNAYGMGILACQSNVPLYRLKPTHLFHLLQG